MQTNQTIHSESSSQLRHQTQLFANNSAIRSAFNLQITTL